MIGQRISHYVVLELLGGGGMGVVYKATDTRLDRSVALKFLSAHLLGNPEAKKRFMVEAKAASSIDHPNIGTIYEVDETADGSLFIAMAYYEGAPLSQRISRSRLSIREAVDIAIQIGQGLAIAHARHIVHRDIKPGNVIITREGLAKIIDFGIAKFSDDRVTTIGGSVGTPAYMSPEQIRGEKIDHRADVWALGVVLYESLTGQLPFQANTMYLQIQSIVHAEPLAIPPHRQIPTELEAILMKALAKLADDRYQQISDFVADLQRLRDLPELQRQPEDEAQGTAASVSTNAPTNVTVRRTGLHTGERRQITALSCAIDDFTMLSAAADPEELLDLLRGYRKICEDAAKAYDGRILQSLDEVITIHFGYPIAHEDNARRAVRAGMDIIAARTSVQRLLQDAALRQSVRFRIGIHTGQVVIRTGGDAPTASPLIAGNVGNFANRAREFAAANQLIITADTQRLVSRHYRCEGVGALKLEGLAATVDLYRVLHEERSVDASPTGSSSTELVGRSSESEILSNLWSRTRQAAAQFVLLQGEAGIGKSRLVQGLKDRLRSEQTVIFECHCTPHTVNSSLHPIIDLLKRILHLEPSLSHRERTLALEVALAGYGFNAGLEVSLFRSLLFGEVDAQAPLKLTPQQRKTKTLAALIQLFLKVAKDKPLLFIVEDLHWVDPTTQEFLSMLVSEATGIRLMAIFVFRRDYSAPWAGREQVTQLNLSRLPRAESEGIIRQVAKKPLPAALVDRIISTTDGVPLFIEELTKDLLESGQLREGPEAYELNGPLRALAIPMTLQDSLMARLDRLQSAKDAAQLASVLGREFPYEWLQAICPLAEEILATDLSRLVDAELLYQRGVAPFARYTFKHAMVRDVAYQSLLKSTRQDYHRRAAEALSGRFAEVTRAQPELAAYHFTEAGLPEPAIRYWHLGGQRAAERSANIEAVAHLDQAIALIHSQPEAPGRDALELKLQIAKAGSLRATKGYGASATGQAYSLARGLSKRVDDARQVVLVLNGLYAYHMVRAEHDRAGEVAEELLQLSQKLEDTTDQMIAHRAVGAVLLHTGRLAAARKHLEQSLSLYQPAEHANLAYVFGADHAETTLSFLSLTLWLQGFPDRALSTQQGALSHSDRLDHSHSIAQALTYLSFLHTLRGDHAAVNVSASRQLQISTEHSFPLMAESARVWLGWAAFKEGHAEDGIREMEKASKAWWSTECVNYYSYVQALIAQAYIQTESYEKASQNINDAHDWIARTNERWAEAELFRVEGELNLAQRSPDADKAEACFQKAVEIARAQQASMWELRAATSLGRLWVAQSKGDAVREMLSPIIDSFTEGRETEDLRAARETLHLAQI